MGTRSVTRSMPCSSFVTSSAFSDEKQIPAIPCPRRRRSLSLAVMTTARAPARVSSARSVSQRRNRGRSEEHTSELQSLAYLVCRLLLEKKKKNQSDYTYSNNCCIIR